MSDSWDFYFCRVNDALSSIFVDLGLRAKAPDSDRRHLLWVWVTMRSPREDGLSSDLEAPILREIEDALTPALVRVANAILAGRITGAGRREFYFYASHGNGFDAAISEVFATFPDYTPDSGEQPDPGWSQYLGLLYPSERQLEKMKNRRVIAALADAEDDPTQPRTIAHWVYFARAADREVVARNLSKDGFRSEFMGESGADTELPFGLRLEREDKADQEAVDAAVFQILDSIEGRAATYDGWESPVIQ